MQAAVRRQYLPLYWVTPLTLVVIQISTVSDLLLLLLFLLLLLLMLFVAATIQYLESTSKRRTSQPTHSTHTWDERRRASQPIHAWYGTTQKGVGAVHQCLNCLLEFLLRIQDKGGCRSMKRVMLTCSSISGCRFLRIPKI